ncbi:type I-E CRISPR-associated protein Cas6/Cse3/CasE [Streptomyces sp. NPDC001941]|uniref:type I-E CRISPR-associated protein Cas6/Cse3/CasE n=1 Tax=Streptomyces sp. NPDC001941 TaxID=3154659 RepID=UPI003329407A
MTTAHLTRIRLNPWSHHAGRDLSNVQSLHTRILDLVPSQLGSSTEARKQAGILFRLERDRKGHTLTIQSKAPLDLDALPVGYGEVDERDLTPLLNWCRTGHNVRYRIDACLARYEPSKTTKANGKRDRGKRQPLCGDRALAWLETHSAEIGLALSTSTHTRLPEIYGSKNDPTNPDNKIYIRNKVTKLEGIATITDPDAVRAAIANGIGHSRAYGAGLLSIRALN